MNDDLTSFGTVRFQVTGRISGLIRTESSGVVKPPPRPPPQHRPHHHQQQQQLRSSGRDGATGAGAARFAWRERREPGPGTVLTGKTVKNVIYNFVSNRGALISTLLHVHVEVE